jgi:hypothetical protein
LHEVKRLPPHVAELIAAAADAWPADAVVIVSHEWSSVLRVSPAGAAEGATRIATETAPLIRDG